MLHDCFEITRPDPHNVALYTGRPKKFKQCLKGDNFAASKRTDEVKNSHESGRE